MGRAGVVVATDSYCEIASENGSCRFLSDCVCSVCVESAILTSSAFWSVNDFHSYCYDPASLLFSTHCEDFWRAGFDCPTPS